MPLSSNSDNIAIATIAPITVTGSNVNISGGLSASFPGSVTVTGSVLVSNFPPVQAVSGGIVVQNWPATLGVSASAPLQVWSAGVIGVSGTVSLTGQASVNNFPAVQNVSGSVAATVQNWPSTLGVTASVPLQVWSAGTAGVSGTVTLGSQVSVNNFPATQAVSGTLATVIQNWPAVIGVSSSAPIQTWTAGAVGVSGSVSLTGQLSVNNFPAVQAISGSVQGTPGGAPLQTWSAGLVGVSGTVTAVVGVTQTAQNVSSSAGLRVWNDSSVGVSGTVGAVIQNWPAIHGVSASVPLQVWTAGTSGISGSVAVTNSQLSVNNFPATQNVSGSVSIGAWGNNVTASVQGVPAGTPLAVWIPGTVGVSGSLTTVAGVTQTAQNVSSSAGLRVYNDSAVGVSGTLAVVIQNWPAVHGVSASAPLQTWNAGTVGVSGSLTLGSQVSVNNFPAIQNVSGSVSIGSFGTAVTASVQGVPNGIPLAIWSPGTIGVSGTFTTVAGVTQTAQNVSSSAGLRVYNDSPVGVSGSVAISTQVSINNFPATQSVSGSVTIGSFATNVTASVQGTPGGIPVQVWSAGTIGVSGTLTSVVGVTQTAQNVSSSAGLRVFNDSAVGVSGTIAAVIQNWPAIHGVSASVPLQVWSAGTTGVSGTVTVGNSQLSINNFPVVQNVSGSIVVGSFASNVTSSIQGVPGGIPVQIWSAGVIGVSGSLTTTQGVTQTAQNVSSSAGLRVYNDSAVGVSGTIGAVIQNWPAVVGVSSSVAFSVFNAGTVGVSGTVSLGAQVSVNNFPATQNVSGSVSVGSFGTNVTASVQGAPGGIPLQIWSAGTVGVSGSLTVVQGVTQTAQNVSSSAGLRVYNDSAVGVSGTVNVGSQVSVNNFPATQAVSGSITISSFGTLATASIQGIPGGIPVQIWSAGTIGVSGTLTSVAGVTQTAQNVSSSAGLRVWNDAAVGVSGTVSLGAQVSVNNFPATLSVSSSAGLRIWNDSSVGVTGSVAATIQNWPAVIGMSASVPVQVFSTQAFGVSGTVSISNPQLSVNNFPATQNVSGSVNVTTTGSTGLLVSAPVYNPIPVYNVSAGTTASAWIKLGTAPNSTDGAMVSTQVAVAQPTYAAATGRFTLAAGATDIWVLQGSATRTVKVHTITFTASGSTGGAQLPFQLLMRSTGNSGGSSGSITPVSYDSFDAPATAKCYSYTANASALGTLVGTLKVDYLNLVSASVSSPIVWSFGSQPFRKPIYLRGINQQLCINLSGSNPATGFQMAIDVEFTEES